MIIVPFPFKLPIKFILGCFIICLVVGNVGIVCDLGQLNKCGAVLTFLWFIVKPNRMPKIALNVPYYPFLSNDRITRGGNGGDTGIGTKWKV